MDLTLDLVERAFRDELESWLAENHPGEPPSGEEKAYEFSRQWLRTLNAGRYAGVSWPREYGGRGATLMEQAIFNEVTALARVPVPANFQGLHNAGPAIILHGTKWQKERYLAPILAADEIWCQGFSEPDAGSDLAGLKARAVRADGGWRLTGQKIWTSDGHRSQMCIVIARTDPEAPRHKGMTYFLMEMDRPGIELRRIRQIDGDRHFNEMFMDEAFVADEDVLGGVGNGWNVAITTLMHERAGVGVAFSIETRRRFEQILARLRQEQPLDAEVRARLAQISLEVQALHLNVMRGLSAQERHQAAGLEGSLTKWQYAEVSQSLAVFAADCLPLDSLALDQEMGHGLVRSLATSIEGGTTEIQKNIIAERVLGLPRLR
jgi:alkylation response protein AidB-like acyl-CoA dehydrogenase